MKGKDRKIEELSGQIETMTKEHGAKLEEIQSTTQQRMHEQLQQQFSSQLETSQKEFETQIEELNKTIEALTSENEQLKVKSNDVEQFQSQVKYYTLLVNMLFV